MSTKPHKVRRALVTGAVVAGAGLGAAGLASAATGSTTTPGSGSTSSGGSTTTAPHATPSAAPPTGTPPTGTAPAGAPDPATLTHGPGETLLTGSDLQKATAAATAAVPGATVIRAETDSSGASPYEVHMKKSDGSYVTVELSSSFEVITTVSGFGAGPAGVPAPDGQPPNGSSSMSSA